MNPAPKQVEGRLAKLVPHAGDLRRDALFFAAGRASASVSRAWPISVGILAAAQCLTLALLLAQTEATRVDSALIPVTPAAPVYSPDSVTVDSMVIQARRDGELPPRTTDMHLEMTAAPALSVRSNFADY